MLMQWMQALPAGALVVSFVIGPPIALVWGAQAAWRAVFKTPPPFGLPSGAAIAIAVLLGTVGMFLVPAFIPLFESYGADLPLPTQMLLRYHYLLMAPVLFLPILLYFLRASARREYYFAAILTGELLLLVASVVALYQPVFRFTEAV